MNKKTFLNILLFLLIFGIFSACVTYTTTISNRNIADIYRPNSTPLHPDYKIYHKNDSSSLLIARFFPLELLFNQANEQQSFNARMKLHYRIFNSYSDMTLSDSASITYLLDKKNIDNEFITHLPVKMVKGKKYLIYIVATDILRKRSSSTFLEVDKTNEDNDQNFSLISTDVQLPFFRNFFRKEEKIGIRYNKKAVDSLLFYYYSTNANLPPPPFSTIPIVGFNPEADSIWKLPLNRDLTLKPEKEGLYFCKVDTVAKTGITILNFGEDYPRIKKPRNLLEPLQYLCSSKEYKKITTQKNAKLALDGFWLKAGRTKERAKELIRIYYSRVKFANLYFSSFTQGWRTDRGMIYVIYGPPTQVFKKDNSETWVYGTSQNLKRINFSFHKIENPYTTEYYQLKRIPSYRTSWFEAIDSWRGGRAFNGDY